MDIVLARLPATFELALVAFLIALLIGDAAFNFVVCTPHAAESRPRRGLHASLSA